MGGHFHQLASPALQKIDLIRSGPTMSLDMEATAESEAAAPGTRAARPMAFELKGVMTSLAVMRLATEDLAAIEKQLRLKVSQLPQFFQDAPVVLDLGAAPDGGASVPLAGLVRMLRSFRLIPVGVTNAGDIARAVAVGLGMGVMPYRAAGAEKNGKAVAPVAPAAMEPAPATSGANHQGEAPGEATPLPEARLSDAQAAGRPLASAVSSGIPNARARRRNVEVRSSNR
jgi:septum formation inhibitor MinC